MTTDYNPFAKSFAKSRENMNWPELEYFFSVLELGSILDIWCGSGRLLAQYNNTFWKYPDEYFWIDLSSDLINEAKKTYENQDFCVGDMLDIDSLLCGKKFTSIFLVASFHHLEKISHREIMMKKLFEHLKDWWKIYMTNWALDSDLNKDKYNKSQIVGSENQFWSTDYSIKIWEFDRYYHCFHLWELETLFTQTWFEIIENRLFENKRNIVSVIQAK